jgi:FdhD protein
MRQISLMKSTEAVAVRKIDLTSHRDEVTSEQAALESPVTIYVNAEPVATLFATPVAQPELAIGYLIGEGIVESYSDIEDVAWSEGTTNVYVRTKPRAQIRTEAAKVIRVLTSACGSSEDFHRLLDRIDKPFVKSQLRVSASEIAQVMGKFNEHSRKFRKIGSFQYAAAFLEDQMKAFFEDVGRHNAVDKTLGAIIKTKLDPSRIVLVSSGRQSAAEVIKAARVGVPISVSIRGPIYSGVIAAQKTGVTLCCYAKGPRMNVYSEPERIILES